MKPSRTLADFQSQFDPNVVVPNKIKAAIAALLKEGPEAWEYESDFMKRSAISQTQIAQFREPFEKHIVMARGVGSKNERRVWFADPKVAAKARGE